MATYRKYVCEHKNGDFKTLLLHGDVKHDARAFLVNPELWDCHLDSELDITPDPHIECLEGNE